MRIPKSVLTYLARHPEKFDATDRGSLFMEQDYSEGHDKPWSIWLYLKKGWHNAAIDPAPGLHIIHESSAREVIRQYRLAEPCDCDSCRQD